MSEHIKYAPVKSCKGGHYFASSDGKIFRIKELKYGIGKKGKGYPVMALFDDKGNKKYRTVHSIIAECFIGPRPQGFTINHKDNNKKNSAAKNLEYLTLSENIKHAFRNGFKKADPKHMRKMSDGNIGRQPPNRKLTDEDAVKLIKMYRAGKGSFLKIGKKFGIYAASACHIVHGDKVYKYIDRN